MASAQPTVGSLGFPKHFLEGVLYFFLGFKALEVCSAMPSMFIPKINDFDANFCQACGWRVSGPFKEFGVSFKVVNHTRLSRRFLEFSDTLTAKPYERQRSTLE